MEHIIHLSKDKKLKKVIELQEPYIMKKRKKLMKYVKLRNNFENNEIKQVMICKGQFEGGDG